MLTMSWCFLGLRPLVNRYQEGRLEYHYKKESLLILVFPNSSHDQILHQRLLSPILVRGGRQLKKRSPYDQLPWKCGKV